MKGYEKEADQGQDLLYPAGTLIGSFGQHMMQQALRDMILTKELYRVRRSWFWCEG